MTSPFVKIIDHTKPCVEFDAIDKACNYTYELDSFQKYAVVAINQGHNILVCAKTGSGKSNCAEYQIAHSLRQGKRVFYTTPIKSLTNQKFHDLKKMYPGDDMVGIMTGDIKYCPTAKIIVMTTEILRNLLYKRGTSTEHVGITANLSIQDVGAVIFDECHYILDRDRGKVWEETMILLPSDVQMVLLSATLDHPELFAEWLGELKQNPCHVIQTQYRIVPLTHYVLQGQKLEPIFDAKEQFFDDTYSAWVRGRARTEKEHEQYQRKVKDARAGGHEGRIEGKVKPVSFQHQLNECVRMLHEKELLPALCFNLSRKGCEQLAAKTESDLLDSSDVAAALHIFDYHLRHYRETLCQLPQYHTLRRLLEKGISFHHSGVLPLLREVIELLFTRGYIKLLYCTETFAVGLNMPTKTVIFTQLTKYDDATGGMRLLRTDEYMQMAGRAGRRGKDPLGTVIYLPDREPPSTQEMRQMLKGAKPQVESRMDFHYDFLLKTLQSANLKWLDLQDKSYWMRSHQKAMRAQEKEISQLKTQLEGFQLTSDVIEELKNLDTLEQNVKELTNAKRRQAQQELNRWKDTHIGPKWHMAQQSWKKASSLQIELAAAEKTLEAMKSFRGNVEERLAVLQELGYVDQDFKLTTRGILASECNESHTLLVPAFYMGGHHKTMTVHELFTAMACFIEEKQTDETPMPSELQVPDCIKQALVDIEKLTHTCTRAEDKFQTYSPESFWTLSTTWIEPVWRWLQGDEAAQICSDHGLFEGNFVRAILRISNMVDEWTAMASYMQDVELLNAMRDIQTTLLRNILKQDSLYLHL
jgi:superfamily II RNA helicase